MEGLGTYDVSHDIEIYNLFDHNVAPVALYSYLNNTNTDVGFYNVDIHDIVTVTDSQMSDDRIAIIAGGSGERERNITIRDVLIYVRSTTTGDINGIKLDSGPGTTTNAFENVLVENVHMFIENANNLSGISVPVAVNNYPVLKNVVFKDFFIYVQSGTAFYNSQITFANPYGLKIINYNRYGGTVRYYHGEILLVQANPASNDDYVEIDGLYLRGVTPYDGSAVVAIDNSNGNGHNPNYIRIRRVFADFVNVNGGGYLITAGFAGWTGSTNPYNCTSQVDIEDVLTGVPNLFNISSSSTMKIRMRNVRNFSNIYSPYISVSTPPVPSSGTAVQNNNPVPVLVYIYGGTVTQVQITKGGTTYTVFSNSTGLSLSGQAFRLDPGDSITITYTTAPTWVWVPA